ncbi:MAG: hypothetical protein AAB706_03035 [Patescibacteria group bacterium]
MSEEEFLSIEEGFEDELEPSQKKGGGPNAYDDFEDEGWDSM